jgi:hypothetical protein
LEGLRAGAQVFYIYKNINASMQIYYLYCKMERGAQEGKKRD